MQEPRFRENPQRKFRGISWGLREAKHGGNIHNFGSRGRGRKSDEGRSSKSGFDQKGGGSAALVIVRGQVGRETDNTSPGGIEPGGGGAKEQRGGEGAEGAPWTS